MGRASGKGDPRIVFLQPGQTVPKDAEDFLHSFNVSTTGLAILGALRDAGYEDLHFLDVACEDGDRLYELNDTVFYKGMPLGRVLGHLAELEPDVVLVTSMFTCDHDVTEALCRAVKQRFGDGVTLVLGGRHASLMPHWFLDTAGIDFLVQGEGEATVVRLLDVLTGRSNGASVTDIPGVLTRAHRPDVAPRAWPRATLGGSFAYDTVLLKADGDFRYKEVVLDASPKDRFYKRSATALHSAPIMPTRGCPLKCRFCGSHFTPELRTAGPERLFGEVMDCYDKGVRVFYNISENFCLTPQDREFVAAMADFREGLPASEEFIACNPNSSFLPIYFNTDKSVNTELISLMKRAGFDLITISLETTAERFDDKKLFRRYTVDQIEAVLQHFQDEGLDCHIYMMSGFPEMTEAELRADVDLVRRWVEGGLIAAASWSNLIYLPGTRYYDEALDRGLFTEEGYKQKLDEGFNFFAVNDFFNFSAIPTDRLAGMLATLRRGEYQI